MRKEYLQSVVNSVIVIVLSTFLMSNLLENMYINTNILIVLNNVLYLIIAFHLI